MEFKVDLNIANFGDIENLIVSLVFKTEKVFTLDDILDLTMKYLDSYHMAYSKAKLAKNIEKQLNVLQSKKCVRCSNGRYKTARNNETNNEGTHYFVKKYIDALLEQNSLIDTVILGCTHYPFLVPQIERVISGHDIEIVDSGEAVARRVAWLLDRYELHAERGHRPTYEFLTFADEEYRLRLEQKALGIKDVL